MGFLSNYESKQPVSQLLKEGVHRVWLSKFAECTSFDELKGMQISEQKENLPEWTNPIDVLAIQVVNKEGILVHRIHLGGVRRYSELSDKELQTGQFEDIEGFACKKTKNGLVRIEDPTRTASCMRILDHFLWALGEPEGTNALACIETAIAEKTLFDITVVKEAWETGDQYRISKFTRIGGDDSDPRSLVTADLES